MTVLTGCLTSDFNLRAIKEDRYLVSADSTANSMKWRTNSWVTRHAKYWSSSSVIITSVDNSLGDDVSIHWLRKIVDKGFKGSIFVDESFDYLPTSYYSEPIGSYKRDIYTYFTETLMLENWAVKNSSGIQASYNHPEYGVCYILNPKTVENVWGAGAYSILKEHMDNLSTRVGAEVKDFSVGLFRDYNSSSWKPYVDYPAEMTSLYVDPLSLGKGIGLYTPAESAEFTTYIDKHISIIGGNEIPLIVYGNRVDSSTSKILSRAIDGVFFQNVTPSNFSSILAKATTYRSSYDPTDDEDSLLLIAGIINDVYHEETPTEYALLMRNVINNGMYFTSGANGTYFNYPRNKPGDWWVRSNDDSNWQNNRNNPEYQTVAIHPRRTFNVTPRTEPADETPPSKPTGESATANSTGTITVNWDGNVEADFKHYNLYRSQVQGNTGLTPYVESILISEYTDGSVVHGETYYYTITAVDRVGNESDKSDEVFAISNDTTPLSHPENVYVENGSLDYNLSIYWDLVPDAASYTIYADDGEGGNIVEYETGIVGDSYEFPSSTITGNVISTFNFQVTSTDEYGNESIKSSVVSGETENFLSPGTPLNFSVSAGQNSNVLTFDPPTDPLPSDFDAYIIYKGLSSVSIVEFLRSPSFPSSEYIDGFVSVGTAYYYAISTIDSYGNESDRTQVQSSTPIDTVGPTAPSDGYIIAGDTELSIYWVNSLDSDLDHVNIYMDQSSGFVPTGSSVGTGNLIGISYGDSYVSDGLENDAEYFYKLKSVDIYGNIGEEGSELYGVPESSAPPVDTTPPEIPQSVSATQNLDSTINISWDPIEDSAGDFGHYNVYRGTISGTGSKVNSSNITTTSYSDTDVNLVKYQNYYYTVTSNDLLNESQKSNQATGMSIDLTAPSVPQDLATTNINSSVGLSWTPIVDSVGDFNHYVIYRGTTSESLQVLPAGNNVTRSIFLDLSVTNNSTYYYAISSVDDNGNESSRSNAIGPIVPRDQTIPSPPRSLYTTTENFAVRISWVASISTDVVQYKIYSGSTQELASQSTTPIATVLQNVTSYLDEDFNLSGETRWYTVVAVDSALPTGLASNKPTPVSGVSGNFSTPSTPTNFNASRSGSGLSAILTWDANPVGDLVYLYNIYRGDDQGNGFLIYQPQSTTYTDSDVTSGNDYYYSISAQNNVGNTSPKTSEIMIYIVEVGPSEAPSNLGISITNGEWLKDATTGTDPIVTLTWDDNAESDVSGYKIYRGFGGAYTSVGQVGGNTVTWTDPQPVGGSPHYYKIVSIREPEVGNIIESEFSSIVSGTPRTIRQFSMPFYYAMWYKDIPDVLLSPTELDSLSTFDGIVSNYFEFGGELPRQNIVSDLRSKNPDLVMYTYMNVAAYRTDWASLPTTTPFRKIYDECVSNNNYGTAKNNLGEIITNGVYSAARPLNFTADGLADFIAKTWVDAYQNSGMDGEYTGVYLDFMNTEFQSWIYPNGETAERPALDADQDLQVYYEDTDEKEAYDTFNEDVLKAFRREFAERGMKNRLITTNGNGAVSVGNIAKYIDGYEIEYFNKSWASGAAYVYTNKRWWSNFGQYIDNRPDMVSQMSPPSVIWEAYTDSNQQYMNEAIILEKGGGWIHSNFGFPDLNGSTAPDSREIGSRAQSDGVGTFNSNIPQSILNGVNYSGYASQSYMKRLPDPGTINSSTYILGGVSTPDTIKVDCENYDLYLVAGINEQLYNPWSYYVEVPQGQIYRRSKNWPTPYPTMPTGLAVASTGVGGELDLSWNEVTNFGYKNGFHHYNVYRKNTGNDNYVLLTTTQDETYTDTGLLVGTTYWYKVSVANDRLPSLESPLSLAASGLVTDTTGPVQSLLSGEVGVGGYVELSWTITPDVEYAQVWCYVYSSGSWVPVMFDQSTFWDITQDWAQARAVFGVDIEGEVKFSVYTFDAYGNISPESNIISLIPNAFGSGETLTFTSGPVISNVTNGPTYLEFEWFATLGMQGSTKSVYWKNSDARPDSVSSIFPWNRPASQTPRFTVTTNIPKVLRDSSPSVSLLWNQETPPNHYHIDRKVDNGDWVNISTTVAGSSTSYIDTSAPRGKLEYRIASADGDHASETLGSWVLLTKVNNVEDDAAYNEAVELHTIIDAAASPSNMIRSTPDPQIYLAPAPPPAASFYATPDGGPAPLIVQFTNTSTGEGSLTYLWSFGDGSQTVESSPSHTYLTNGTYTVTLQATTQYGSNQMVRTGYIVVADLPVRVVDDLLALYEFDEGSGSTINDTSPISTTEGAINFSITNQSGTTSWIDDGLKIDSAATIVSTSAARVVDACSASNEFTIEMWVTPQVGLQPISGFGPSRMFVIGNSTVTNVMAGHGGQLGGSSYTVSVRNGIYENISTNSVMGTIPIHIVYTKDSTSNNGMVYVNGILNFSASQPNTISSMWSNLSNFMLANNYSLNRPWFGTYHLLAIYGRELTSEEVLQNYTAGTSIPVSGILSQDEF